MRVCVAICLLCCLGVKGYVHEDPVSTLKRSQYRGYRTQWSSVLHNDAPHFGLDQTVRLHTASQARDYQHDKQFKMSFSFDNEQLITPWITVNNGLGVYLHVLQFTFVYSSDRIVDLKWEAEYVDITKPVANVSTEVLWGCYLVEVS